MFSVRFPRGQQGQLHAAPWLKFIHAVNSAEPEFFGQPTAVGTNELGDYIETYPDATVMFPADDVTAVVISATTARGNSVLACVTGERGK